MKKRNRRALLIVFLGVLILYGPTLLIPIGNPYYHTVINLRKYVSEQGGFPPSEAAFRQFDPCEMRPFFTPPFNIKYGAQADDWEIRDKRVVHTATGERGRLIFGGRSLFYDVLFGWRYNALSRELLELMQSGSTADTDAPTPDGG